MSNEDFEEYKRELVEDKLRRYSETKERKYENRLTIPSAKTQPSQTNRHSRPLKGQEARRHK